MKKHLLYVFFAVLICSFLQAQNVGIGTTTPSATLHIKNPPAATYNNLLRLSDKNNNVKLLVDSAGRVAMGDLTFLSTGQYTKLNIHNDYNNTTNLINYDNVWVTTRIINGSATGFRSSINKLSGASGFGTAIYADASQNNLALYCHADSGWAIDAQSNTSYAGSFTSSKGIGIRAQTITGAYAIEAIGNVSISNGNIINEAYRQVGSGSNPAFGANWSNFGAEFAIAEFYKDKSKQGAFKGHCAKHNKCSGLGNFYFTGRLQAKCARNFYRVERQHPRPCGCSCQWRCNIGTGRKQLG